MDFDIDKEVRKMGAAFRFLLYAHLIMCFCSCILQESGELCCVACDSPALPVSPEGKPNESDATVVMDFPIEGFLDAESLICRGIERAKAGQIFEARADFSEAIRIGNAECRRAARNNRAKVSILFNDVKQAVIDMRAIVQDDPSDAEAFILLGICTTELAQQSNSVDLLDDAVDAFNRAEALRGSDPELHFRRARALYGLRRYDEAERDATRAVELVSSARVWLLRACIRHESGNMQLAMEDIDRSLALSETPEAHTRRGLIYFDVQRFDDSAREFDAAVRLCRDQPHLLSFVAETLVAFKQYERACQVYDRMVAVTGPTFEAIYGRGHCRLQMGNLIGALSDLDWIIAHLPGQSAKAELARKKLVERIEQGSIAR